MGSYEKPPTAASGEPVVKLDSFVVSSRSMDGAAVASHEQRFAAEMKTVVAADEFGLVAEANVAEMIKFTHRLWTFGLKGTF